MQQFSRHCTCTYAIRIRNITGADIAGMSDCITYRKASGSKDSSPVTHSHISNKHPNTRVRGKRLRVINPNVVLPRFEYHTRPRSCPHANSCWTMTTYDSPDVLLERRKRYLHIVWIASANSDIVVTVERTPITTPVSDRGHGYDFSFYIILIRSNYPPWGRFPRRKHPGKY